MGSYSRSSDAPAQKLAIPLLDPNSCIRVGNGDNDVVLEGDLLVRDLEQRTIAEPCTEPIKRIPEDRGNFGKL